MPTQRNRYIAGSRCVREARHWSKSGYDPSLSAIVHLALHLHRSIYSPALKLTSRCSERRKHKAKCTLTRDDHSVVILCGKNNLCGIWGVLCYLIVACRGCRVSGAISVVSRAQCLLTYLPTRRLEERRSHGALTHLHTHS